MKENIYRTHTLNDLREADSGKEVILSGWVDTIRDHGGITFVDLRDHYGKTQLVFYTLPDFRLSKESVIRVEGKVRLRESDQINEKIDTGRVEVVVDKTTMLSYCKNALPFEIDESRKTNEDVRLQYRFLDLRNKEMQDNIVFRSKVIQEMRNQMIAQGFTEFQTPILTVSSPEGARDYIVPSRINPGKFYALPQAPQQFKQLLMVSGMDRYFQIAPCFRDEDARADRCPGEFYQLDVEMSFATQEDVFTVMEEVLFNIFNKFGKYKIKKEPFVRIPYREAMEKYGSDKPDLRNPIIIKNITKVFEQSTFGAFKNKCVRSICVPSEKLTRKDYDELTELAMKNGAKGLAYIRVNDDETLYGPILKFLTEEEQKDLVNTAGAKKGDVVFMIADKYNVCSKILGLLRTELCNRLDMLEKETYKFCWIVDFPMFEYDEENEKIDFCHNPFSMPQGGIEDLKTKDPLDILAYQYDIILNGVELSSGAVRNHDLDIMIKAFEIAGYTEEDVKNKFAALYTAFQYGVPPHAGIAPGVDRMIMLLLGETSIREVVAFPMNKKAQDLMMGAPGYVTEQQLREVHIKLRKPNQGE